MAIAYKFDNEVELTVTADQITLARADREKDCQRLISYAIGCMMGRYSLDAPGLIYAHAGNIGFDASRYPSFPADADGILPVTDQPWFADDAAARIREFLHAVWGPDTLEENLAWLARSLIETRPIFSNGSLIVVVIRIVGFGFAGQFRFRHQLF